MKPHMILGGVLLAALTSGGCDASKADLEKARTDLASISGERDGLKTQLEQAKAHENSLTSQLGDLNAKLAAAQSQKGASVKPAEHAQATSQKVDEKPGKKASQAPHQKKG